MIVNTLGAEWLIVGKLRKLFDVEVFTRSIPPVGIFKNVVCYCVALTEAPNSTAGAETVKRLSTALFTIV